MAHNIVIVGTQWGDEGKGKVCDYLSLNADVIVRYQGGNNAGHTIVFDNNKYALHLIPSGIFNAEKINIMGNGMVINLEAFYQEVRQLQKQGIKTDNLFVSNRAHVTFEYHIVLDQLQEKLKGSLKVGTTNKGIGPTYADKYSRIGIRISDLFNQEELLSKIEASLLFKNILFKQYGLKEYTALQVYQDCIKYIDFIKPFVKDTSMLLDQLVDEDKKVLFEGAQGAMLDIEHGTYPFVTSSSPGATGVASGAGIGPSKITKVLGITKAYTTRVGAGAFVSEIHSPLASEIREAGHEYGTTTKRPRRIGWLDTVVLNHTRVVNGLSDLAIMLLDVLSGLEEIKICYAYSLKGETINYIPANIKDLEEATPLYISLKGWHEDLSNVKTYEQLPDNAKIYLKKIEELTKVKISLISVGASRYQTIVVNEMWE
ncbi:MAG: adenylosuccinate synthase [Bacilli bacterium]